MIAVLNCRMAILDWFLKKPINVNHCDKEGNNSLHYAAKLGYTRIVRQLLSANIKTANVNTDDETPEDVAFNDAVKALIKSVAQ